MRAVIRRRPVEAWAHLGLRYPTTVLENLFARFLVGDGCWEWLGQRDSIVVYHHAARMYFKATLDNDEMSKGEAEALGLAA